MRCEQLISNNDSYDTLRQCSRAASAIVNTRLKNANGNEIKKRMCKQHTKQYDTKNVVFDVKQTVA